MVEVLVLVEGLDELDEPKIHHRSEWLVVVRFE